MIGRSGSSAGSWVAASQSLRIGRWRWGAEGDCIGGGPREIHCLKSCDEVCDALQPNAMVLSQARAAQDGEQHGVTHRLVETKRQPVRGTAAIAKRQAT